MLLLVNIMSYDDGFLAKISQYLFCKNRELSEKGSFFGGNVRPLVKKGKVNFGGNR